MRLIMCCTVQKNRDFLKDLRFSYVASKFWRRLYPDGEVCLATNVFAEVPKSYGENIRVLRFPFEANPFAMARANFLVGYAESNLFDRDTVFTGHDVLFLKQLPNTDSKVVTNYRFHPSQPYCADLLVIKVNHKNYALNLLKEFAFRHSWMPQSILDGPADQLSWALTLGLPDDELFTGEPFTTPRKPDVLALSADQYLFTPNDYFPSRRKEFGSWTSSPSYEELMNTKTALHYKGNRKEELFKFAEWAEKAGHVELNMLEKW